MYHDDFSYDDEEEVAAVEIAGRQTVKSHTLRISKEPVKIYLLWLTLSQSTGPILTILTRFQRFWMSYMHRTR